MSVIEHDRFDHTSLATVRNGLRGSFGGLHLNTKGNAILAKDFINFVECWNTEISDSQRPEGSVSQETHNDIAPPRQPISTTVSCSDVIDLDKLEEICKKNRNNPKILYLNINHIRNKVVDLRCILNDVEFTYLAISETKIDDSFPSTQFKIDGYVCPKEFRKDRTENGGGMLIYIKNKLSARKSKQWYTFFL